MNPSPFESHNQAEPGATPPSHEGQPSPRISRRAFVGGAAAVTAGAALTGVAALPAAATPRQTPKLFGSVSAVPWLPAGFRQTFTSQLIHAGGIRQHAVIGGDGPPLLLIHGWPQNWYAWRMIMPVLARQYTVIAVDQRGIGLTDKPRDGYDTATLAGDLAALMDALGHERFAVVGHDTGMPIAYALAADHRDRVDRLAVAEAVIPGVTASPPLLGPAQANNMLWHFPFNRLNDVNERLVAGREDIYFGWQLDMKAARKLPAYAIRYYVESLTSHRHALSGSFGWYRDLDTTFTQNADRVKRHLTIPVLAIGGAESVGEGVANTMKLAADDVQPLVIPGSGHWVAEEAPQDLLAALIPFLAPYRATTSSRTRR
ncbi:alpha/beta hydrolase (plasmid) [Streptomyces sp. NBC_01450]|uniref:alpha/beta fold hydrolase n=1 Tax=Streptomyces sp. NBC_01450 TaxID=2903871 RepID=UPI002E34463D|nr:alpha/beta hydrolase [Streptomyces sp. NBC_01450]